MEKKLDLIEKKLLAEIDQKLESAQLIVTKNYLEKLEMYDLEKPSTEVEDINVAKCGSFFRLSKLAINDKENFLDKLTTIVNVVSSIDCTLAVMIKSDGSSVRYYLGIISKRFRRGNQEKRREANTRAFIGSLLGNFTGSDFSVVAKEEIEQMKDEIYKNHSSEQKHYSSISGIVSLRDDQNTDIENYVQGIENLVDSLKGQKYSILTIADPLESSEIQMIKKGYEMISTELSSFLIINDTYSNTRSLSISDSYAKSFSESLTKGITLTQSKGYSSGYSSSTGGSAGFSFFASINGSFNNGKQWNENKSRSEANNESTTINNGEQETNTKQHGESDGRSIQLSQENRTVKSLLKKIDNHLERLDRCNSYGAFECATYVIAEDKETAITVASNYSALMRGQDSSVQASHINTWSKNEDVENIGMYLRSFCHPQFTGDGISVTPASVISGNELAIQIGLPKKSIPGVTVIPMVPFGRNVLTTADHSLMLGNLYHMGHDEGSESHPQKVELDIESLSMHAFITGSTGSGKTTVIYSMLDKLMNTPVKDRNENIRFMVIEPAKGEYKDRFGQYDNVKVYGTNYRKTPLLRIDPFSFPEDVHVLEHIDRLIEIFNVCWPMYAAMPAVLKDSIERAYMVAGWKLDVSECKYHDTNRKPLFPTFKDVLNQINIVMNESQYSADSKGDYKGALSTRLKSLTNGLYGQIFTNNEIPADQLFDQNVIVDLSRTGSSETKSLIMGLLVMKLQEYRMSTVTTSNHPLQHVTVLEEAHNILKRTSTAQSEDSSNMVGKSVEMLANSIAEMRTYGEGFIIADQAPGLMDMSVIRNTNTKIVLRLPDLSDRELVGKASAMNDEQIVELSRLKTFVAAVYQNNWLEPVLCNIDRHFTENYRYICPDNIEHLGTDKNEIIQLLLISPEEIQHLDKHHLDELLDSCYRLSIPAETKVAFTRYLQATNKQEIQRLRGNILYSIFNSETAFDLARISETDISGWCEKMCTVLDPDVNYFDEIERQKILAVLTKERADREESVESVQLFEKLMNFM